MGQIPLIYLPHLIFFLATPLHEIYKYKNIWIGMSSLVISLCSHDFFIVVA